jgi:hypothetical protein
MTEAELFMGLLVILVIIVLTGVVMMKAKPKK